MVAISNIVILFILVVVLSILYQRYVAKKYKDIPYTDYDDIRKYLLNESDLAKSKKPILWIHVPYEYNARNWTSFGSRSSLDLNQPYLYLTVKSIIKCCEENFYICIIDDNTFGKLLTNWSINMDIIPDPIKSHMRMLGIAKLIHSFGGMNVPISFLCLRDLTEMYVKGTKGDKMFVCENVNNHSTSVKRLFYPDCNFMGAPKENETVADFIQELQRLISNDYTAQMDMLGDLNRWCNNNNHRVNIIGGKEVGTKTLNDVPVLVDMLLSNDYIDFYKNMYGIWIPASQILKRRHYEWFSRMDTRQILESNTIIGKYMLLALAPDSNNGVVEPFHHAKPEWISFWKTPLVYSWGQKPNYLGNNLLKAKYPNY